MILTEIICSDFLCGSCMSIPFKKLVLFSSSFVHLISETVLYLIQRLVKVFDKIIGVFETDGNPDH